MQLKALFSRNRFSSVYGYAETKNSITTVRDGLQGYAVKRGGDNTDQLMELTAQYNGNFNDHNVSVLGGYSYQDFITETSSLNNSNFPAGNFSYIDNIGVGRNLGLGTAQISSSKYASNLIGFFSRRHLQLPPEIPADSQSSVRSHFKTGWYAGSLGHLPFYFCRMEDEQRSVYGKRTIL